MDMFIKVGMLVIFVVLMVCIGLYCRKKSTSVDSFVLGGRNVGAWFTAFAYGTSYFSAVVMVGYAGQFGWRFGIASTWIGLGNALIGSYMAWAILGRRTRVMTQHLESRTMPDFFAKRYNSPALRTGAALIIFVFLIPYAASMFNGLSRLFSMAFEIDYTICIIAMAVLTAIYVVAGGYLATVVTDFIQGIIMIFCIIITIYAALDQFGGLSSALAQLAEVYDETASTSPGAFTSFFGADPFNLLWVIILTSLGTWSLPQMTAKFYAIKDENAIVKGTIISTLFALIVSGGCYFLGGFGRLLTGQVDVAVDGYDAIIPTMLQSFSPVLLGMVVVLVLSASMSTLSSLVLTASSTLTLDLIRDRLRPNMGEKRQLSTIRILILFFITVAAVIAILQYKYQFTFIAQLMGLSWGALAGAFLGPYLWGLYSKRITKAAVWTSYILGVGLMLLNMFVPSIFPSWCQSSIVCGALAMLLSLVVTPLVSLFTKKTDSEYVDEIFRCYERKVTVTVTDSIGAESTEK